MSLFSGFRGTRSASFVSSDSDGDEPEDRGRNERGRNERGRDERDRDDEESDGAAESV